MKIESMAAEVRPRISWEAIDLGFAMMRSWWKLMFAPWLFVNLVTAVSVFVLLWEHPWIALIILWWLKPLFNRLPLYVMSQALFGERPEFGKTIRSFPGLLRHHLIQALTFSRFDLSRSFNLPVWQLEKLSGQLRRERLRVLQKSTSNASTWLTGISLLFTLVIAFSAMLLVLMLIPEGIADQAWNQIWSVRSESWVTVAVGGFLLLGTLVVEPFYIAGGFALYLNRRSHLEGWDIELAFRRISSRLEKSRSSSVRQVAVLVMMGMLFMGLGTSPLRAEVNVLGKQEAKQIIEEIKKHEDFGRKEKRGAWYPIAEKEEKKKNEDSSDLKSFLDFLKAIFSIGEGVAKIVELLLWLFLAFLVAVLIVYLLRWAPRLGAGRGQRKAKRNAPTTLFGMDVRPESLPDDVAAEALGLWADRKYVEAVSLLYRGALVTLINRDGIKITSSATEGDCVKTVFEKRADEAPEVVEYFSELTRVWQLTAYAHRIPHTRDAELLCKNWTKHFGVPA